MSKQVMERAKILLTCWQKQNGTELVDNHRLARETAECLADLKEAIKQAGDPVAWMLRRELWERYNGYRRFADSKSDGLWDVPVYTAAPSIPAAPYEAIGSLLAQVMDQAVANGANSVSMPDEYVEIAAWLSAAPSE